MDGQHPERPLKYLAALLLVSLSSCSHVTGGVRTCEYPLEDFAQANADFLEGWESIFGPDEMPAIEFAVRKLDVTCTEHIDGASIGYPGWIVTGYTQDPGEVVILTLNPVSGEPWTLRQGSYFHELVHVALWTTTGDGDVTHAEGDGPWEVRHDVLVAILKD